MDDVDLYLQISQKDRTGFVVLRKGKLNLMTEVPFLA